jgi:hypothetical protein
MSEQIPRPPSPSAADPPEARQARLRAGEIPGAAVRTLPVDETRGAVDAAGKVVGAAVPA